MDYRSQDSDGFAATPRKGRFNCTVLILMREWNILYYEEILEYVSAFTSEAGELSEDELALVAGGKGDGVFACGLVGLGVGSLGQKSPETCFVFGIGLGVCFVEGLSLEPY